jgi:hypothetical protein
MVGFPLCEHAEMKLFGLAFFSLSDFVLTLMFLPLSLLNIAYVFTLHISSLIHPAYKGGIAYIERRGRNSGKIAPLSLR